MDGCSRQNSKKALKPLDDVGALVSKIAPRSPDINPIEKFLLWLPKQFLSKSSNRILPEKHISGKVKHELRVQIHELQVQIHEL